MSGVASVARRYADAVAGTSAQVFDTRKTTLALLAGKHASSGIAPTIVLAYMIKSYKENHIALMVLLVQPKRSLVAKELGPDAIVVPR